MFKRSDREGKKGITLDLKVTPGAHASEFAGVQAERLRAKVAAKAVEGAANQALVKLIASTFNVSQSNITLLSGKTGRLKTVFIAADRSKGNEQAEQERLAAIAQSLINAGRGS